MHICGNCKLLNSINNLTSLSNGKYSNINIAMLECFVFLNRVGNCLCVHEYDKGLNALFMFNAHQVSRPYNTAQTSKVKSCSKLQMHSMMLLFFSAKSILLNTLVNQENIYIYIYIYILIHIHV